MLIKAKANIEHQDEVIADGMGERGVYMARARGRGWAMRVVCVWGESACVSVVGSL